MYPVLFRIGTIPIETYYAIWFAALSLALRWSIGRMPLYGIDDDAGRTVIAWGFLGMFFGARAPEYIRNFSDYWNHPSLILDLSRGGLSERGAILGAVLVTFLLCRRSGKVSFLKLCEVVVLPGCVAIAIGRWGCFFAGCCVGVESAFPLAFRFPYDAPPVARHATQLYYSLSAALILLLLLFAEKRILRYGRGQLPPFPILTPLGLVFYSIMRMTVDPLRLGYGGLAPLNILTAVMIPLGAVLSLASWNAFRKKIK